MANLISIPLSKAKNSAGLAACSAFAWIGWWLFHLDDVQIQSLIFNNPKFVHSFGLFSFVLLGTFALWFLRKLFDNSPGLQFLENGFIDNTNMFSLGFIAWEDVTGLEVREVAKNQKLLYVLLRSPAKYISKCGFTKRVLLGLCMKLGPSPVTIVTRSLSLNLDEVIALMKDNYAAFEIARQTIPAERETSASS
ncbi:STM3941 family protein [Rhodanobacter soli]|uniref:STM3941 family protein n=1 Tax=Rhodanobacter soli TaxID=590609 RepID=UPI0031DB91FC